MSKFPTEGWAEIYPVSKKFHYFRDRRSLCGKFQLIGKANLESDDGIARSVDCTARRKKLDAEKKRESEG